MKEALRSVGLAALVVAGAAVGVACGDDDNINNSSSGGGSSSGGSDGGTTSSSSSSGGSSSSSGGSSSSSSGGSSSGGESDAGKLEQAAKPTFEPAPGPFDDTVEVKIKSTSEAAGAFIYFTTDGSNPTTTSSVYSGPISLGCATPPSCTKTIRAIAGKPGSFLDSEVAVGTYTINVTDRTATPEIDPPTGSSANVQAAVMRSEPGATICYTLDGNVPACSGGTCQGATQTYNSAAPPLVPVSGTKVQAIACMPGKNNSLPASATYTYQAAAPVASPGDAATTTDFAAGGEPVRLSTTTNGGVIHYTTNGSQATCLSPTTLTEQGFINGGSNVAVNTTVRAITCKGGFADSAEQTFVYTVKTATPAATPAGTDFSNDQALTFSSPTGGSVCYRMDGQKASCKDGDPTACAADNTRYTTNPASARTITKDGTQFSAVACSPNHSQSEEFARTYHLKVAKVEFAVQPTTGSNTYSAWDAVATFYQTTRDEPTVRLRSTTSGAKIRYTTDGSAPTACGTADATELTQTNHGGGNIYATISVTTPVTVRTIACKADYQPSEHHGATIGDAAAQVSLDILAGAAPGTTGDMTGANPFEISVTSQPADALVCFSVGAQANPDCDVAGTACIEGQAYNPNNKPQILENDQYFNARACKAGLQKSSVARNQYTLRVRKPTTTPAGGSLGTPVEVPTGTVVTFGQDKTTYGLSPDPSDATPTTETSGVTFHYTVTTNGTDPADPTCSSPTTGASLPLTQSLKIKVIACKDKHTASTVEGFDYTVNGLAPPQFSLPGGPLPQAQTVTVSTLSASASGVYMCVVSGEAADATGIVNPDCQVGTPSCIHGDKVTAVSHPAGFPVAIAVPAMQGQHTYVKAITCDGGPAANWRSSSAEYSLQPSKAVLSLPSATPYAASHTPSITLADAPTGVTQTQDPVSFCYTTNGASPQFNPATCAPTANTGTTCIAGPTANLPALDETTPVKVASCKAGYIAGAVATETYKFAEYARPITMTAASMLGGGAVRTDGKFSDAENKIATTDAGYSAYLSWDATNIFVGFHGLNYGRDDASQITSFYLLDPSGPSTDDADTTNNGGTGKLPAKASDHIVCKNGATANAVTCSRYTWDGAAWNANNTVTASRASAADNLIVQLPRSSFGLDHAGSSIDRLVFFGTIAGTDSASFPAGGAAHYINAALNSYHTPNDNLFLK